MQWQGPPIDKCQKLLSLLEVATKLWVFKSYIFMYTYTCYFILSLYQKEEAEENEFWILYSFAILPRSTHTMVSGNSIYSFLVYFRWTDNADFTV